ncbi:hypothetical protein PGTUg99_027696 [Puccinia graminis f. sp. tritici]|uniref:Uncharacterized protein n=1 Tax=Puccinia graminis f. sp. tritici TaxID=56615 RepID=A0A5B0NJ95_PUCGR|nr:hypothetical protein PGTUg99_027696 [Puccinia graminis f. sp. tritici]
MSVILANLTKQAVERSDGFGPIGNGVPSLLFLLSVGLAPVASRSTRQVPYLEFNSTNATPPHLDTIPSQELMPIAPPSNNPSTHLDFDLVSTPHCGLISSQIDIWT